MKFKRNILVFTLLFLPSLFSQSLVFGQKPIKAPSSFDKYTLSNIRIEDDRFGRTAVICDYQRTKKGEENHSVRFVARTESGILNIMGSDHLHDRDSGVISLSKSAFGGRKYNFEIYLVADSVWAGKTYDPCMISNAVRIGTLNGTTVGRMMNAEEKKAYQRHLKGKKPPTSSPPSGYELATLSSQMVPGMYVMAGRWGDWEKAEFLGMDEDRKAKLRFEGENTAQSIAIEKWIAVDPDDIAKAKESPSSFKPSGATLEGGKLLLPPGAIPLDYSVSVVPGTPLLYEMANKWREVIVTKKSGGKLSFRMADFGSFSRTAPVSKLAIKESVVKQLNQPDAEKKFAENLYSDEDGDFADGDSDEDMDFGMEDELPEEAREAFRSSRDQLSRHRRRIRERIRDYPIDDAIPRNCQIVPDDLKIPKGTKVAGCFHFDWTPAKVISDPGDGTLYIDWDEYASAWNGRVKKEQFIIQNKTLAKIKREAEQSQVMTASELSKITRTWTDSSGQHKVEANFVRKTEKEVVLKMKDGYEKTLPLQKLSKEDRELLSKLKEDADNPFAR